MQKRIRLREWEYQNYRRLYLLKYRLHNSARKVTEFALEQIEFVSFVIWIIAKIAISLGWALLVGPRTVRHIEPGKAPQECYEFEYIQGGGLWK